MTESLRWSRHIDQLASRRHRDDVHGDVTAPIVRFAQFRSVEEGGRLCVPSAPMPNHILDDGIDDGWR